MFKSYASLGSKEIFDSAFAFLADILSQCRAYLVLATHEEKLNAPCNVSAESSSLRDAYIVIADAHVLIVGAPAQVATVAPTCCQMVHCFSLDVLEILHSPPLILQCVEEAAQLCGQQYEKLWDSLVAEQRPTRVESKQSGHSLM